MTPNEKETADEVAISKIISDYIKTLSWSKEFPEDVKGIVIGNIRSAMWHMYKAAFQAGRTSVVSEIREKKRQKDTTDPKKLTDYGKGFMSGFNQYSDEMDKLLTDMEHE